MPNLKNKIILFLVLLAALLITILVITKKVENERPYACTMEAKICPDGTAVGRTGPLCEFAPCPMGGTDAWETYSDPERNIMFKYPKEIGTSYITSVDWPPLVVISPEASSCTAGGSETDREGKTEYKIVDGVGYCVTRVTEGAAGSIYTQYAYKAAIEGKAVTFTFSLRATQCDNYDNPEKKACELERKTFNPDQLLHTIAETFGAAKVAEPPLRATLIGTYVCLPHKDTTGPQTDKCAIGLRTDAGVYYSLDFNLMSESGPHVVVGDRMSANGVISPVEQLSSTWWQMYPITGIFMVTDSLKKL